MRPAYIPPALAFLAAVAALNVPLHQRTRRASLDVKKANTRVVRPKVLAASKAAGDSGGIDLTTANDLIYIVNVTVGGVDYPVQLDTGSSDLWIHGPASSLPNVNHTDSTLNLTYGIGWAFGNISTATVDFAGLSLPSQVLLDTSSAQNPALTYGADGILGLGFTSLSTIDSAINKTGGSWGRSLLYNAFSVHPKELNYITFSLHRSDDPSDDVEGTFTLGEVDPQYSAISDSPSLSTWPIVAPNRWNVLLDSFIVGTTNFNVTSTVAGVPGSNAVALLDSGTSFTYCPTAVADAIYGNVPGAMFDQRSGLWDVPCEAEIDMALQFGGQVYPLHPLDVVPVSPNSQGQCVGSFVPSDIPVGSGQFDWLIGDNVLRSMYSLYDFGDFDSQGNMGNPYVKLLALVDPNGASADFTSVRGGTPRTNITYNAASGSGASSVVVTGSTADKLSKLVDYVPAMLGILALNALALLVISIVGVIYMCRKSGLRRKGAKRRSTTGSTRGFALSGRSPTPYPGPMSPIRHSSQVELVDDNGEAHEYQRVAVHAPAGDAEDQPFVPPEPSFHSYDGDSLSPMNTSLRSPQSAAARPRSMFSVTSSGSMGTMQTPPRDYRVSTAGSDMTAFVPPSPGFLKDGKGRPKSFA